MGHTFSSMSPKNEASAQLESRNMLAMHRHYSLGKEEQSFINPFSIASCKNESENS